MENLAELEGLGEKERGERLVELNVRKGVEILERNPVVMEAVEGRGLKVHACVYDVGTGLVRELAGEEGEERVKARKAAFRIA